MVARGWRRIGGKKANLGKRVSLGIRGGRLAALLSQFLSAFGYPGEHFPGSLLRSPGFQHLRVTHWNLRLIYGGIALQFDPIFRP